jgi:hypothetical protein
VCDTDEANANHSGLDLVETHETPFDSNLEHENKQARTVLARHAIPSTVTVDAK